MLQPEPSGQVSSIRRTRYYRSIRAIRLLRLFVPPLLRAFVYGTLILLRKPAYVSGAA